MGRLEDDLGACRRAFLILWSGDVDRAEVGDRGGHDDDVGGVARSADRGLHLGRGLDAGPPRRRRATGRSTVVTSVTSAPRARGLVGQGVALLARGAVADEAHRVDRLAGAAGGDEHPQAGQVAGRRATRSTAATIASGSARRPAPTSPPARRPVSGGTTMHAPLGAACARLSCTAGCSHISVCMAGQTTHRRPGGEQRGGEQVVGDARGVGTEQAGGGRARPRSGRRPGRGGCAGWGRRSSHSEVCTGSEASAEKVVSPTKRVAPSVRTGATWAPASTRRRQTSTAL